MQQTTTMSAGSQIRINRFLAGVYFVMSLGMVVTALVSTWVAANKELLLRIATDSWLAFGLFILQMILVVALSAAVTRLSPAVALLIFLLYSALTGLTISTIFIYYSQSLIASTFWLTAGMFFLSSLVGFFIKKDLGGAGQFLLMLLLGWTFSWFLVWIFPSPMMSQAMNITGIALFAALTVWDTQRLKLMAQQLEGKQGYGGLVVVGALALYLDFINLFLLLLRARSR
jgi:hypothetical protein